MVQGSKTTPQCCIVGGGPAGMMLAFLLARAGIEVEVLEKHADFLRDFRGDTIHPSTLDVIHELGLLDAFLALPHDEITSVGGVIAGTPVSVADFSHSPTCCKFVGFMPQWDFLNFLAKEAKRYPTFRLSLQTEVVDLLIEDGRVRGVKAIGPDGDRTIRADLTVGCDGRASVVRAKAQLPGPGLDLGAPMDVLWFRLARRPGDPNQVMGFADAGVMLVLISRGEYWQCGLVVAKGSAAAVKERGLEPLRSRVATLVPFLADRVAELTDWKQVSVLTVRVERLLEWSREGLLCIGDAAHAMSPIGGVGINLAIQDAVAAANLLVAPLANGTVEAADLRAVQERRSFPTRATQRLQLLLQDRVIRGLLDRTESLQLPWVFKLLEWWPALRRIPARVIGVGFRPEHVHTPDVFAR